MTSETLVIARVTRRFGFTPERVFDAFLDPAKAGKFMFATETGTMVRAEVDARVGGRFAFVDRRGGEGDIEHTGEYLVVDRPRRLEFTLQVTKYSSNVDRVLVEIAPTADGCEVTLTHEMGAADAEYKKYKDRTEQGWAHILDGLEKTLR